MLRSLRYAPAAFACLGTVLMSAAIAQDSIAIVLDASGSMSERMTDGRAKIDGAKEAIAKIIGDLPPQSQIALWVFSHQKPGASADCDNIERIASLGSGRKHREAILNRLKTIQESGSTPIAASIKRAAEDLLGHKGASAL